MASVGIRGFSELHFFSRLYVTYDDHLWLLILRAMMTLEIGFAFLSLHLLIITLYWVNILT